MHASPGHNTAPSQLRSYVDRLVRLEEQKREIADDIKDVKNEAKSSGFDKRVLSQMVREALMDADQRAAQREFEEICELYRASLGMLNGTPLGQAARRRAAQKPRPPEDEDRSHSAEDGDRDIDDADVSLETPEETGVPTEDLGAAKEKGRTAAQSGTKIFANPYVYGDPRRAAWDEGHCEATGSDGMEIPESWRRKPKKKPGKGDGGEP